MHRNLSDFQGWFEKLFRANYASLVGYAESFIGVREDAEEIVSDLFTRLYEQMDSLDVESDMRGYLFRSVRNRVFNHVRNARRLELREHSIARDAESVTVPDVGDDAVDREAAIARAIAELPDRAREVVALHWAHGLTYEQIAKTLDITIPAAKMQASRAIKLLREKLGG